MPMAYFDMETIKLNGYMLDAKLLTAQYSLGGKDVVIFKEWELGERDVIISISNAFREFIKYTPIFTYNGSFDFHFLMDRADVIGFSKEEKRILHDVMIRTKKHCDLMQYGKYGEYRKFFDVCSDYDIFPQSTWRGKNMELLYINENYDGIIAHATDDIMMLVELVDKSTLGNRFLGG